MAELHSQQCSKLTSSDPSLEEEESSALLSQLEPQWELDSQEQSISFTYDFKNYYQTMAFVNIIAQIAHQQDHHPDLFITYNRCKVTYTTHSVGGLSLNDFICAAKINTAQNL